MSRPGPGILVRRVVPGLVFTAYAGGAALLLLWPNGEQVRRALLDVYFFSVNDLGLPRFGGPDGYAVIGNVLVFVPMAAAITLYAGWRRWWSAVAFCAAVSLAVEMAQSRSGWARVPQWDDVLHNVLGAAIGALLTAGWLRWAPRRRRLSRSAPNS